ncbi:unnamed protein product [Effrenium voratum]|uniref:Uncharacterized protein n=2 Tax=Effrenium voratum TaxID=2562239 RepID=A0AA36JE97_9DINO|nr:unnamed protein product [Effrenium voratum]
MPKETAQQTSPELWPQAPAQLSSQPNLPKPSSTVATQTDTVLGPSELSPEVPRGDWAAGVQHEVREPRPSVEQDPSPHRAATQQGLVLAADPRSKSKPGQGPAPSLTEGMTPSTSTASLPHRGAFASVSSAMLPSASGSSIQASHNQSLELPPEPEAIRSQPNLRSHESISPVAETRLAKRKSLEDLGFVASPDRLGRDRERLSRERELAVSPSRQVSHVSQESHELEILEAKQQFVRQISESIGQQAAAAQLGPAEAAKSAAQAAQRGAAEQGLSKEEAVEVAASCAGLAAAEAAVQLGYSPEEAALTATEQTSSTASALGLNRGQALQSAAHAVGAVIGKAAAESHWNPADAAGHAANTLRKFIDANDAHDNLIQTTATATHEAARAVALAQGAPPALAHQIGAEEASRITSQLVHQKLRFAATSAVAAASPGAGAGDAGASRFVASVPRNTGSRGSEGSSSRSSRPSTKERPMSKGLGLPEALDRVPLPPLNLEKESITKSLPLAQPSRPAPVKRRFSITELTMPDMPQTARRASQAQALEQHGSLTERQAGPRLSASEYPESARILGYARTGESPESRPAEKPERPHRGPSQEPPPFQRRASAIQLELEAVLPSTKPKLQGWQRVREKRDEKATALGLSPERGRARRASLTPRPEPPEETSSPETDRRNFAQHIQMTKVAQERPSPPRRPPGVVPQPPSSHPAGAAAAGRAMRLNLAVGKAPAPAQPLDATHALQELRARKPSSKKSTEKAQLGGDLRIDAVRPLPEARSPDRARRRQSHLPEAKSKEAPFAPDMASLFVGKEEKEKEAKRHEREVRERQASPGEAPSFTPRRVATDRLDTAEGKPFGYSPGSTVRDAEGLGNMLSVSSLNVDPKVRSSQSFHKTEGKEADVSPSRSLRGNADDASPRSRKEEREAKEGKDADESPTRSLTSHIERGAARIKEAELIPSEPPKEPPKPKESKEGEAEVLVKRVCESLDRKFGSVDAAFLSMSAKMNRLERAESLTEGDDKEDRTLLQLRGCLVESGVGHKDATLLLQAMRSGLPGQMPSLQDVANSLRPGCLQQAALDQAKKKSAFSLSGSDDPNINLDSIRGISNLDARSILERQGAPVILPLPAPPGARSRSNSPGKRSGSSSPKRNATRLADWLSSLQS